MKLEVFDVQHGACAMLTTDDNRRMMIDCGRNSETGWSPTAMLRARGVNRIELLAITNYDEDHVRDLVELRREIAIERLWRSHNVTPAQIKALKSEDGMGPGIDSLVAMATVYSDTSQPMQEFLNVQRKCFYNTLSDFDDENNLSMVVQLKVHNITFLFPGDLHCPGWEKLLERPDFSAAVSSTTVLMAPHHGRENGLCEALFREPHNCRPMFTVISDKGFMHDTQNTGNWYYNRCIGATLNGKHRRVITTRRDGTITFDITANGWSISMENP